MSLWQRKETQTLPPCRRVISLARSQKYGHPVHALETFLERSRFQGTCCHAANWKRVGETRGRTRNDRNSTIHVKIKDV